jgi:hypothetical protein
MYVRTYIYIHSTDFSTIDTHYGVYHKMIAHIYYFSILRVDRETNYSREIFLTLRVCMYVHIHRVLERRRRRRLIYDIYTYIYKWTQIIFLNETCVQPYFLFLVWYVCMYVCTYICI